jgi:hypothetical protein
VNLYVSLALGFSATQHALRLFGAERTVFAREALTGINRVAYVVGKNISSLADLFILPFVFLSMFYSFSNLRGAFRDYFTLLVAAQWALSGISHVISVVFDPAKAQLAAVVVTLILNAISGYSPRITELGYFGPVCNLSYGFWLMEALFIIEATHYPDIFQQTKNDIARKLSYHLDRSLWVHIGPGPGIDRIHSSFGVHDSAVFGPPSTRPCPMPLLPVQLLAQPAPDLVAFEGHPLSEQPKRKQPRNL